MSNTSSRNTQLLIFLNERCLEYLVVGGWAVKHYCPDRSPRDLDLWINPSSENLKELRGSLLQYFSQIGQPNNNKLKDKLAKITDENRTKPLHVCLKAFQQCEIFEPGFGFDFPSLIKHSIEGTTCNVPTQIMSCCDLIKLKSLVLEELRSKSPESKAEDEDNQQRIEQEIWDINCLKSGRSKLTVSKTL